VIIMICCRKPKTGLPTPRMLWDYRVALGPIGVCTFLNTALNNKSLTKISLFLNQVIKSLGPFPTMVFAYLILGTTVSYPVLASIIGLVGGCALANADKFDEAGKNNQIQAIILCFVSLLAASLKPVIAQKLMNMVTKRADGTDAPKLSPEQVLFFDTQIAFWFMFIYWIISDERADAISYLASGELTGLGLAIIVIGSTIALCFNLATYYFISLSGALATTVGSNAVKIVIIVITAITDGGVEIGWAGVVLVALMVAAYTYFTYREKQQKLQESAAAAPTEATPLASVKGDGAPAAPDSKS